VSKKISAGHFLVVANSKARKAKAGKEARALVSHAYQANTLSKTYDLDTRDHNTFVIVRNKSTGQLISKFKIAPENKRFVVAKKNKKAPVRKLDLEPRDGTISMKRILNSI